VIIEEIFAFIIEESPGQEGVPAFQSGDVILPLFACDPTRIAALRPIAKQLARDHGKQVTLCKFSVREEIEVIEP
jgi:dihydroorotase-like cyclic amidohydrolase